MMYFKRVAGSVRGFLVFSAIAVFAGACGSGASAPRIRPTRDFDAAAAASPELVPYLTMLEHPGLAWSGRKSDGAGADKTFAPDPALSKPMAERRSELQQMLEAYAPRLWWHPRDPFPPMDPMDFIAGSSLRYRSAWGSEKIIKPRGELTARELRDLPGDGDPSMRPYQTGFVLNGRGYFLKYEDPRLGTGKVRDWNYATLDEADWPKFKQGTVPVFWRLGKGSAARELAPRILIEYWYHVPFNWATRVGIGNHQGDWEGMATLVELGVKDGKLTHHLIATYYSEHENGTWRCAHAVQWTNGPSPHPEAFSAMGTHATYPDAGRIRSAVLADLNARGRNWDTWHLVRPLELEPYYGYSGAWGEPRGFSFMTGPLVPGPGYKPLPRETSLASLSDLTGLRCRD